MLSIVPRTTKKSFQTQSNGENFLQRFLFWRLESHFKRLLSPVNFRDGGSIWSAKWPQWPHYGRRTIVKKCSDPYFWSYSSFSAVPARNFMIIYWNPYLCLRRLESLYQYMKMFAMATFIYNLWSNICPKMLPFRDNRKKPICRPIWPNSFKILKISFLRLSRKGSILGHMLLHNININTHI